MNIEKIYLIEIVESLYNEIKMFEKERIKADIISKDELEPLYDLYYNATARLNNM